MHINKINGKAYIGITCKEPTKRWGHNGAGYQTQPHFWRAIQKYGWENFEHYIIETGLTEEEACDLEVQYIAALNTRDPDVGYNYEPGGKCHDKETRIRIGNSERGALHHYYGKHRDAETRRKISESLSGENHYWYGKHLPESTRRKISEANKGKVMTDESIVVKPVVCVETGDIYISATEAAKAMGVGRAAIAQGIRIPTRRVNGYHWKLLFDDGRYVSKEYAKSLETSRNDVGCKHMASEMESSRIRDEDIVRSA